MTINQSVILSRLNITGATSGPSAGAPDEGKIVRLNSSGLIDASFITSSASDHGSLIGLGDDDHAQYHNDTRGDLRYYTKTILFSTAPGEGASLIKIEDSGGFYTSDTIEGALQEIAGGGGTTDHGSLIGLGDDDHAQYHNDTRGDIRYHTKTILASTAGAGYIGTLDAGGFFNTSNVEDNLTELADGSILDNRYYLKTILNSTANNQGASLIGIEDTGGHYSSVNVEGALQELGGDAVTSAYEVKFKDTGAILYGHLKSFGSTIGNSSNPASARFGVDPSSGANKSGYIIIMDLANINKSFSYPSALPTGKIGFCLYPDNIDPNTNNKHFISFYNDYDSGNDKSEGYYQIGGYNGYFILNGDDDNYNLFQFIGKGVVTGGGDAIPTGIVLKQNTGQPGRLLVNSDSSTLHTEFKIETEEPDQVEYFGSRITTETMDVEDVAHSTSLADINMKGSNAVWSYNVGGHPVRMNRIVDWEGKDNIWRLWHNDFRGIERFSGANIQRIKMELVQQNSIFLGFKLQVTSSMPETLAKINSAVMPNENFYPVEPNYYSIIGIMIASDVNLSNGTITVYPYINGSKITAFSTYLDASEPSLNQEVADGPEQYVLYWDLSNNALTTYGSSTIGVTVTTSGSLTPSPVNIEITLEIQG